MEKNTVCYREKIVSKSVFLNHFKLMANFELMVSATHHNFKKLCFFREENLLAHQQKSIHLSLIIIEK